MVDGLVYLHAKGVVHRDIKGANVLVHESGGVKLADFGCSTLFDGLSSAPSGDKGLLGSVPWMAPEVTRQDTSGRKSDVWSLGCTVVEMCTGKRPWHTFNNHLALLYHIGTTSSAPPTPPGLPAEGVDFMSKCFAANPDLRWSAEQLRDHPFVADAADRPTPPTG